MDFIKYALKGNDMLHALAKEMDMSTEEAGRVLTAVLYAVRDHLSVQESLHVCDQLPMALKGIFVSQWNISRKPDRIRSLADFLNTVRRYDQRQADNDLGDDEWAADAVGAVFRMLNSYISDGEFEDLISVMPAKVRDFISSNTGRNRIL